MTDAQKAAMLDWLCANLVELNVKNYGWVYKDNSSDAVMLERLEGVKYMIENPDDEDEDSE